MAVRSTRARWLREGLLAAIAALLLVACPTPDDSPEPTPPPTPTPTPTPAPTPTPTVTPDDEVALDPGPAPDHVEPDVPDEDRILVEKRVGAHDGFERVVLEFGEDYESVTALPPTAEIEMMPQYGAVRVHLDRVVGGATTPLTDIGGAVTHVYHAADQDLQLEASWVDIYTDAPVEAVSFRLADPARVVVDLITSEIEEWGAPAAFSDLGVLLSPDPAVVHSETLEVSGYASPFEGFLSITFTDEAGEVVYEEGTMTAAWAEARGAFAETVDVTDWDPGAYTLRVEYSPGHEDDDPLLFEVEVQVE